VTQLEPHAAGNLEAGNTIEVQIAAMIHCLPYIGYLRVLNAIRVINCVAVSDGRRAGRSDMALGSVSESADADR
jgi:hypothetical protein